MPNDSTSPLSELRNLCNWLEQPVTQQWLADLREQADNLKEQVLSSIPASREQELRREQAIGCITGLLTLEKAARNRKEELEALTAAEQHSVPPSDNSSPHELVRTDLSNP